MLHMKTRNIMCMLNDTVKYTKQKISSNYKNYLTNGIFFAVPEKHVRLWSNTI